MNFCSYHSERLEAYSDDNPDDYADDSQYFDIDISLPFSPTHSIPTSNEDDSDDEFELDLSMCTSNLSKPNQCISPAENLFYESQLLPLQIIPTPLADITSLQFSSNVPGVKTQFPNFLGTATKLNISFSGFRKSAKLGRDLKSPNCAEYGTAMDSPVPKMSRLLTVKFKVVEVPLVSLFSRDNSKGSKRDVNNQGFQKESEDFSDDEGGQACKCMDRDKKRAKEIVMKHVKKIKPLFVKISQMYDEKISSRDLENSTVRDGWKIGVNQGSERSEKHVSFFYFSGKRKIVYNHLGKRETQPSDIQQKPPNYMSSEKTLMEIQSSIQEAIAHCKRSNSNDDTSICPNSRCRAKSYHGSNGG